jgi:tripeptidyl-peptidase-1
MAALVSLINEQRLTKGMPAMGFLNPFLYQNADCFTDVVKGTNAIDRDGSDVPFGFAAASAWDAATGLGTPVFDKLLAAALAEELDGRNSRT